MRTLVPTLLLAVVGSCGTPADNNPVISGGGPPGAGDEGGGSDGGTSTIDAISDAGLEFRVCLVTDLRGAGSCATTGAENLTVTLGSATALTAADGTFELFPPLGTGLTWVVSGSGVMTSQQVYGTIGEIPAISTESYQQLANLQGLAVNAGSGAIVLDVVTGDLLASGVAAASTPELDPYYDISTAPYFTLDATGTGSNGTVWWPNVAPGELSTTLTPSGGSAVEVNNIPVGSNSITFAVVSI